MSEMEKDIASIKVMLAEMNLMMSNMAEKLSNLSNLGLDVKYEALKKLMDDTSVKIDTLSSNGIELVTPPANIVLATKETKTETKAPEVEDPGNLSGNIAEYFKKMFVQYPDILVENKFIGDDDRAKHAAVVALKHGENRQTTELRKIAGVIYKGLDDKTKDRLKAMRKRLDDELMIRTTKGVQPE